MPRTIRLNPTWESAARILLAVVENGDSEQAKQDARDELLRMARGYDAMLREHTDYFEAKEA